jgi:trehalose utilization protein
MSCLDPAWGQKENDGMEQDYDSRMRKRISDPEGLVAVHKVHIVMSEIQI